MKTWKWIVVLLAILSLGILIVSGLLDLRLLQLLKFPVDLGSEQMQLNRSFLERPGTLVASIGALFTLCFSGILILYSVPDRVRRVVDSFPKRFRQTLRLMLLGFLIEVLMLAIGISSALMIGTFPLTILLIGVLFVVGLIGFVSLAYTLGRSLLRRANWQRISPVFALSLGTLILFALIRIPVVGGIFFLMITSLGLGATVLSHFGSGDPWTLNPLLEE